MKPKAYFILSTHWDREWYQTFQNYRYQLVGLIDDILNGIIKKEFSGPFYTDGQVCLLEDYLEIRPDKSEIIRQHLKDGKLVSGPWYVLPDEFLISGESIIRNLRLGTKTVRQLGGQSSKVGFLCDMFGHISQIPQILNGFGIKAAILWRGVEIKSRNAIWQGADGSKLAAYVFPHANGYGDYAIAVRNAIKDYFDKFDAETFCKNLDNFLENEAKNSDVEPLLIFDGLDHQHWDKQAYQQIQKHLKDSDKYEFIHTSLDDFMAAMLTESDKIKETIGPELRQVSGQNYKEGGGHLIFGVLSSRVDIKQSNTECQNMLCGWAEPFSLFSSISTGQEYPQGFLDTAWKWLILNHPHDSICGCSIDQVHEDMKYRFSQSIQISERLTNEALKNIAASIDTNIDDDQMRVTVFNPLAQEIDQVVQIPVQIPAGWNCFEEFFGFEKIFGFKVYNPEGKEIEYQRLAQHLGIKNKIILQTKMTHTYESTQVDIALKLKIPALGYTSLTICKTEQAQPIRHSSNHRLCHSGNTLENEFLKVAVLPNGTLNILDKQSGQCYENLLCFEDNADIGDGWYHGLAVNDETFYSSACSANVSVVHNGPEMASIKIENEMSLPQEFIFSQMKRSPVRKDLNISTVITLTEDSKYLEVQTTVYNIIKDHRLRVVLPTSAKAESYLTDSVFDVIERKIALSKDNHLNLELDTDTKPQQSWTAISDGTRGLAVASLGLYETAVSDEPEKPIKLTLFRSTQKTVHTSGEPNGQLQKQLKFKYLIMPISGKIDRLSIFHKAQQLGYSIKTVQLLSNELKNLNIAKNLPAQDGLLEIKGAVLTSLSKFDNKPEIRFFNPADEKAVAMLKLGSKYSSLFKNACKVDNQGNPKDKPTQIDSDILKVNMQPKEIGTICLL